MSFNLILHLRRQTGLGLDLCNAAAKAATDGTVETSLSILNQLARTKVSAPCGGNKEGAVGVLEVGNSLRIRRISCATDFVSRNEAFLDLFQPVQSPSQEVLGRAQAMFGEAINVEDFILEPVGSHRLFYHIHSPVAPGVGGGVGVISGSDCIPVDPRRIASHVYAMNPGTLHSENGGNLFEQRFIFDEQKTVLDIVQNPALISAIWRFAVKNR